MNISLLQGLLIGEGRLQLWDVLTSKYKTVVKQMSNVLIGWLMIRRPVNPRVFLAKSKHQVSRFVTEQTSVNSSPPRPPQKKSQPLPLRST